MSATDARALRRAGSDVRLERLRCRRCGQLTEPPALMCPHCGAGVAAGEGVFELIRLTPGGRLVTWVVQHVTPFGLHRPTILAIVETPEGGRLAGELVDCPAEALRIDLEVEAILRRSADPRHDYEWKFRPHLADKGGTAADAAASAAGERVGPDGRSDVR